MLSNSVKMPAVRGHVAACLPAPSPRLHLAGRRHGRCVASANSLLWQQKACLLAPDAGAHAAGVAPSHPTYASLTSALPFPLLLPQRCNCGAHVRPRVVHGWPASECLVPEETWPLLHAHPPPHGSLQSCAHAAVPREGQLSASWLSTTLLHAYRPDCVWTVRRARHDMRHQGALCVRNTPLDDACSLTCLRLSACCTPPSASVA